MELLQTEGIVLHALPFKEYDRILTVFTPQGIQKFFAKGTKKYNPLTSPLTCGEFVYKVGRNELHRLQDGTPYDQNLKLRNSLESLLAAEKLVSAILESQMPGKAAPSLYILFQLFLSALDSPNPERLCTTFYLKIMKYEGVLQIQNPFSFRFAGECYPKEEAPPHSQEMTLEEENLLQTLTESRSLKEILFLPQPKKFEEKIFSLFTQAFANLNKK